VDPTVAAAARALSAGDPLGALRLVALRRDAPALALRGIAVARLGDLHRARVLLRRAHRAFGPGQAVAKARCATALAEIALASREPNFASGTLEEAARLFARTGERSNEQHARLLVARRLLLLGRVAEAEDALARLDLRVAPPAIAALGALAAFDVALRRRRSRAAQTALARARDAARRAAVPSLRAEVERAGSALELHAARLVTRSGDRPLLLGEVEALFGPRRLVVDGCRRAVSLGRTSVSLTRRPVLFALIRALAEAWPGDATRDALVRAAFGARAASPSLRARLRVEVGRLRRELHGLAAVQATPDGFALVPARAAAVAALAPPIESAGAAAFALLCDGTAWSTSALALALGMSQRTAQRALAALEGEGRARTIGRGRARRWLSAPSGGFTTALLLPLSTATG
jgi:hypothetical protein